MRERERGACGKICYPNEGAAYQARRGGAVHGRWYEFEMAVYRCDECNAYHIGHLGPYRLGQLVDQFKQRVGETA